MEGKGKRLGEYKLLQNKSNQNKKYDQRSFLNVSK